MKAINQKFYLREKFKFLSLFRWDYCLGKDNDYKKKFR